MPLVNIDLLEGRTQEELRLIGDSVHQAMTEQLNVPKRDRFQIITQHTPATLQFDRDYLDIERSDRFVMVRVTLAAGRSTEAKTAFYGQLAGAAGRPHRAAERGPGGHPGGERPGGLVVRPRPGELPGPAAGAVALAVFARARRADAGG
jgi:4-oxalocrotonate tautomerase